MSIKTTRRIIGSKVVGSIAAGAAVWAASSAPVSADTINFTNTPASAAAAALNKRLGATIVFRGSVNTSRPVTFSVDNPGTAGGRLPAVSSLAGALDLDFQKVYVVSKAAPGASLPSIPIDADAPVVFRRPRMPVREAIQTVAAVDGALAQISGAVEGTVDLPSGEISASEAAASIAKQTGTQWKAYYGLFPRGQAPARLGGLVVDRTADGQAITKLPLLSFRGGASHTVPLHSGQDAVVGPLGPGPLSGGAGVQSVGGAGVIDGFGLADPFGYGGPYGPFGYAGPNGTFASPGSVVTPGGGVAPAVPGVNARPVNAAAGPNGTAVTVPTF